MEVIESNPAALDLFVDGDEYFALLRPEGMLARVVAAIPDCGARVGIVRHQHGALVHIPASFALEIVSAKATLLIEDRLRLIVSHWYCAPADTLPPQGE